ncbi:hypothetical protein HDU96_009568 [Phlyctochytrium bullatum]|nr:hypothetical protein HDU96_009568 [Phlyctochytrium bullatum]
MEFQKTVFEIVDQLVRAHKDGKDVNLNALRASISKKNKLNSQPRLVDIIAAIPEQYKPVLLPRLRAKPIRTASGIAVVAVMCGPDSDFEYSTQSYTGYEPTSMRAIRARYNPYDQARGRIDQLKSLGHSVDKVEYIIMGGTFMSLPEDYRNWFIANLHNACSGHTAADVDEAVKYSEHGQTKVIGITIETRPDWCLKPHLSQMLRYGCTRLEIGVQSVYEDVARDTNRGHTVKAVCEAFHLAKDAGYKVVAHMMPDLPNVGMERDVEQFKNPAFRSDGLKIYPTLVIRGTANGGWETFLSYEDPKQDILIGLLRLRKCSEATFRKELKGEGQCSIVRELHVYGTAIPVHSRDPTKFQHQGFGTLLMEEAERIAKYEHKSVKIAVISGVGTRHYYRKLGYELDGPYMSKRL